jgi:RNA polymerase sigma factor (sigma-70 family)
VAAVPSIGRATRVEGHAAPETEATRALYERYGEQVFGYCLHQLGSREEAEDAVQSTFLNAFRGLGRGIVPDSESAWLFAIAGNVCLSRRRATWRRGRIESPADFEVVEELTPAPSRRADELIGLQDVLAQMPEAQRRAILLREWQGLSYREIAEELELTQSAVETLIFRARRSLAEGLEASPAEQRSWRSRMRSLGDLGGVIGTLKSLLAAGATAKVAGVAAVVAVSSVAAIPVTRHHPHAGKPRPVPVSPAAAPAVVSRAPLAAVGPRRPAGSRVRAAKAQRTLVLPAPPRHAVIPAATVAPLAPESHEAPVEAPAAVPAPQEPAPPPVAPAELPTSAPDADKPTDEKHGEGARREQAESAPVAEESPEGAPADEGSATPKPETKAAESSGDEPAAVEADESD